MKVWDFINSINYDKADLFEDPQAEKDYVPFIVNKGLSYFPDTIFFSNEMNRWPTTPKRQQYDFLRFTISKRKRFSKWAKRADDDRLDAVQQFYQCSPQKAQEIISLLTPEQLEYIETTRDCGGIK
jgi:hypothetical protein